MSNRTIEDGSNCRNRSRNGIAMEQHRKHRLSMAQGDSTSCYDVTHAPRHDSTEYRGSNRRLMESCFTSTALQVLNRQLYRFGLGEPQLAAISTPRPRTTNQMITSGGIAALDPRLMAANPAGFRRS